jgi:class 3 adenylate cyclase/tetratricopeptide (TPR) repeat protein
VAVCPVCEQENPDVARFCLACGAALGSSGERREERKVVTVLFADLVGFTSRAERLDPEDVRAVLAPYWERLRGELERHGGTVEKFIGDAVMALFGAPVAHEDDPERAVRAALAIRDWARGEDDLQVRIAVTTGEALVLLGARPAEGEGMAAGDVVNTAARLQAAAPVNGVLVGESTYRATRDVIDYEEREPVHAKGKTEPVPTWEALQARSRLGMDLEQRALLPLVGRVRELETLIGAFDRARREREPQLVTLVGVPGIGKSRLVAELFARLDAAPDIVWWRQGRALPYGQGVSFWALGEMVKAQAGIHENDSQQEAEAKLRVSVETSVAEPDRDWVASHLRPLVGLESPQELGDRRDESFAAWRRYLEGLAEQRPLVLAFEDLHWADDGILDLVDHLAEWASGVPMLLLGTARPELLDRRPGWGGGKLNATTLALSPLADDEAARIIGEVMQQALIPAETQQLLLERAGGNPLYAEQFARLYVERGSSDDLPLPETIQGIIAARLDGLDAEEKRLLQEAAVVGKVFWSGAIAELAGLDRTSVGQALHSLARKELVRPERRSAVGGEEEFAFRHVLVRDVAYGQIPRAARAEKHARVATWIEELGRSDDHAELVSHHYRSALELAGAAGGSDAALEARARVAFRNAGDRAFRLNAFGSAQEFYADALALWPEDPDRPYVLLGHARASFHAEGAADAELAEAAEALEACGDVEGAAQARVLAAHGAWRGGRSGEASRQLELAHALVSGRPPSRALVEVLAETSRIDIFAGRRVRGDDAAREALRLAGELGFDDLRASVLATMGVACMTDGELDRACALSEQAAEVGAATAAPEVARALINLSVIAYCEGDLEQTRRRTQEALDFARRIGERRMLLWIEVGVVRDAFEDGRWDEAVTRVTAFLAATEPLGGHYLDRGARQVRGEILAARGDAAAAARDLERSMAGLDESEDNQQLVPTYVSAASICLRLGDRARAETFLDDALARARETSYMVLGVNATSIITIEELGRGQAWLDHLRIAPDTRRMRAARLALRGRVVEAADEFAKIGGMAEEAAVRLLAARRLIEAGRRTEGDAQLHRALAFYRAVGAVQVVREAEALLAAAS